jgi:rhamnulose-1-phosphate aldolase
MNPAKNDPLEKCIPYVDPALKKVSEIAGYLWRKGWAERNAGNISVNLAKLIPGELLLECPGISLPLLRAYRSLANAVILMSVTGTRMRAIAAEPRRHMCLLSIAGPADSMKAIALEEPATPSSETPAHLAIHEYLAASGSSATAVIHTHPDRLIALSHIGRFKKEAALNRLLWSMHPETSIVVPGGAGFVPYEIPGSEALARATVTALSTHKIVVWEKHGVVAVGKDLDEAFDTIDTLDKAASVFFLCKAVGEEPEGLSPSQLKDLELAFKDYGKQSSNG